jgi:phosphoglucosamine mutase
MTVDFALRLASAAARVLAPTAARCWSARTRALSGYMFESALEAGFVAAGVDVLLRAAADPGHRLHAAAPRLRLRRRDQRLAQPLRRQRHQVLRPGRRQASRRARAADRGLLDEPRSRASPGSSARRRASTASGRTTRSSAPRPAARHGPVRLKLVIDCANGAAYKVAPRVLADLGAEIIPIGCSPNGRNINDGCGSTEPGAAAAHGAGRARARRHRAGRRRRPARDGRPPRPGGGRRPAALRARARAPGRGRADGAGGRHGDEQPRARARAAELGIEFRRAAVGDRYVLQMLREARRHARRRDVRAPALPRQARRRATGSWRRCRCSRRCASRASRSRS